MKKANAENLEQQEARKQEDDFVSAADLLARNVTELPTLVDPIVPKNSIVFLVGSSDTGKSAFLRQLAVAIVTGEKEFLGFPINAKYGRVIYVSTEDDEEAMAYLLNKQFGDK